MTRAARWPDRNRWRPIAADIRGDILSARYAFGAQLPSNAALRTRYGVSGQTVQNAMNSLRGEGLVETRPGRGWFVRRPPALVRLPRRAQPDRCLRDRAWLGCGVDVVTRLRFDAAAPDVAEQLRIEPGAEILVRERTMSDTGEVVALATSYFPRSLTRGTVIETTDTGPGGVFSCLLRLGHDVVRHVEQVTVGVARDHEAHRFGRSCARCATSSGRPTHRWCSGSCGSPRGARPCSE